jgi:thiol-disulfide isomerase/thioredoxin
MNASDESKLKFLKLRSEWILPVTLAVVLLGGIGYGVGLFPFFRKGDSFEKFRDAPRFELSDDQGKPHRLDEIKGELILLHFWATWCAPCLEELPSLVEFARKYENDPKNPRKPIRFVTISLDHSWDEAHRYLKAERLPKNLLSLLDPKSQVPEAFGSYQFPETYLLGPDLKILAKWVGPQDWSARAWDELLDPLFEAVLKRYH